MGNMQALAFADDVREGGLTIEKALVWHLQSNHYPPVPVVMVPVCKAAIDKANSDACFNASINLPDGVLFRGQKHAPVFEIIRQYHLDSFLEEGND